ncbi:MAG: DNA (cytosine-5-)-methyltransferase, partial [Malacoplasma sp.]|nr:DNA (cytosine-5-)-methyltransferase [Malacoplasma sp.]
MKSKKGIKLSSTNKKGRNNNDYSNQSESKKIYFGDFFAGIGGFHYAFNNVIERNFRNKIKPTCVYVSEIDKFAKEIYSRNFQFDISKIFNIHEFQENENKKLDIIFCGFPCQSFSSAGNKKGFEDETRGTLIFKMIEIIKKTKPKIVLLENVKHLVNHDNKKTFNKIIEEFKNLNYIT